MIRPDGYPVIGPDGNPMSKRPMIGPDGHPLIRPDGQPVMGPEISPSRRRPPESGPLPDSDPFFGPDSDPLKGPDSGPLKGPDGGPLKPEEPNEDFIDKIMKMLGEDDDDDV